MAITKNAIVDEIKKVVVNGYTLPVCSEYSGSLSDVDVDSGRSVNDGIMLRNRLRNDMHKLEFKYSLLTYDQALPIIKAVKPVFVNVEFFALDQGKRITRKMYVGDKTFNYIMAIPNGQSSFELCVQQLSFNLIER